MASIARIARTASRSLAQFANAEASQGARTTLQQFSRQSARNFAAGGGHDAVTYGGLTIHKPAKWHTYVGEGMAGLMWFWIFYRFYHDYETFLFGHAGHHERAIHRKTTAGEHGHH